MDKLLIARASAGLNYTSWENAVLVPGSSGVIGFSTVVLAAAVSPDNLYIYAAGGNGTNRGRVQKRDMTTHADLGVWQETTFQTDIWSITISRDGSTVYAVHEKQGVSDVSRLYVIDAATMALTNSVTSDHRLTGIAVSPDNSQLFLTRYDDDLIEIRDRTTLTSTATVSIANAFGIAFSADGSRLYTTDPDGNSVSVWNSTSYAPIATIVVPAYPRDVEESPDGGYFYVASVTGNAVSIINSQTLSIDATHSFSGSTFCWGVGVALLDADDQFGSFFGPDGVLTVARNSGNNVVVERYSGGAATLELLSTVTSAKNPQIKKLPTGVVKLLYTSRSDNQAKSMVSHTNGRSWL